MAATDWGIFEIGSATATAVSEETDGIHLTATGNGLQTTGDNIVLVGKLAERDGSLNWQRPGGTASPTYGIMARSSSSPDAAFIFVGYEPSGAAATSLKVAVRPYDGATTIERRSIPFKTFVRLEWVDGRCFVVTTTGGVETRSYGSDVMVSGQSAGPLVGMVVARTSPWTMTVPGSDSIFGMELVPDDQMKWSSLSEPFHLDVAGLESLQAEPGRLSMAGAGFSVSGINPPPELDGNDVPVWETVASNGFSGGDFERVRVFNANMVSGNIAPSVSLSGIPRLGREQTHIYARWQKSGTGIYRKVTFSCPDSEASPSSTTDIVESEGNLWVFVGSLPAISGGGPSELAVTVDCSWSWSASTSTTRVTPDQVNLDGVLLLAGEPSMDIDQDRIPDDWEQYFSDTVAASMSLSSLPPEMLLPGGDFDGDGWTNYEEYLLQLQPWNSMDGLFGEFPPILSKVDAPAGMGATAPVAFSSWSRAPFGVLATYPDGSGPVPGYLVQIKQDFSWETAPYYTSGLAVTGEALPQESLFLPTSASGIASAWLWTGPPKDGVFPATMPENLHILAGQAGSTLAPNDPLSLKWDLHPYVNVAPGPVDVTAPDWRLLPASDGHLTLSDNGKVKVIGPWLVAACPNGALPGRPVASGYIQLYLWSELDAAYAPAGVLAPPNDAPVNARFGSIFAVDPSGLVLAAQASGAKASLFQLDSTGAGFDEVPVATFSGVGYPSAAAVCPDWVAIGSASAANGSVLVYGKDGEGGWIDTPQVLQPTGSTHSDQFGAAIAFAPVGDRILVGAPSNLEWFNDPNNAGYYDEGSQMWIENDPPTNPAGYVFKLGAGTWSLEQKLSPTNGLAFGTTVGFVGDFVVVGAPGVPDAYSQAQQGCVHVFGLDGNSVWQSTAEYTNGNPTLGRNISVAGGMICADNEEWWDTAYPEQPAYLRMLDVLNVSGQGVVSVLTQFCPATATGGWGGNWLAAADEQAAYFRYDAGVQWHEWCPVVDGDAPDDALIASLSVQDGNASDPAVAESVQLAMQTSSPSAVKLVPAVNDFAVKVNHSAALVPLRNTSLPIYLQATDAVGEEYWESTRIHVNGLPPPTPELLPIAVQGSWALDVTWQLQGDDEPSWFAVQRADRATYIGAQDSEAIDAAFSQVAAVYGQARSYRDTLSVNLNSTSAADGVVYRVVAHNDIAQSAPSDVEEFVYDADEDGLPDWWELSYQVSDPTADDDGDGLTNLQEFAARTNPNLADSDGDGVADNVDSSKMDRMRNGAMLVVSTPLENF